MMLSTIHLATIGLWIAAFLSRTAHAQCVQVASTTFVNPGEGTNTLIASGTSAVWSVPASKVTITTCAQAQISAASADAGSFPITLLGGIATVSGVSVTGSGGTIVAATDAYIDLRPFVNGGRPMTVGQMTSGTLLMRSGGGSPLITIGSLQGVSVAVGYTQYRLTIDTASAGTVSLAGGGSVPQIGTFTYAATVKTASALAFTAAGTGTITGDLGTGGTVSMTGQPSLRISATQNNLAVGNGGVLLTLTGPNNVVACTGASATCSLNGDSNNVVVGIVGGVDPVSTIRLTLTVGISNTITVQGQATATIAGPQTVTVNAGGSANIGALAMAQVSSGGTATLLSGVTATVFSSAAGTAQSGAVITVSPSVSTAFMALSGATATLAPSATLIAATGVRSFNTNARFAIRTISQTNINNVQYDVLTNELTYTAGGDPEGRRRRRSLARKSPDELVAPRRMMGRDGAAPEYGQVLLQGPLKGKQRLGGYGCRRGLTQCPVIGGGTACVDLQGDIFNCGGCALVLESHPRVANATTSAGVDCTAISDQDVICLNGQCQVG